MHERLVGMENSCVEQGQQMDELVESAEAFLRQTNAVCRGGGASFGELV